MKNALPSPLRTLNARATNLRTLILLVTLPLSTLCAAQTLVLPAQAASAATAPTGRADPLIQRIRVEDAGSRIDEVRVGGQTQSITVQPKMGPRLPAYEVKPAETVRGAASPTSQNDMTGSRVWNVLKF